MPRHSNTDSSTSLRELARRRRMPEEAPEQASIADALSFDNAKRVFDFLRNLFIALAVVIASFALEYSRMEPEFRDIFYSQPYGEMRELICADSVPLGTNRIRFYEQRLYGMDAETTDRVFEDFDTVRESMRELELFRLGLQFARGGMAVENALLVAGAVLAFYNAVAFAGLFGGVSRRRLINVLSIAAAATVAAAISTSALRMSMQVRSAEFFGDGLSADHILETSINIALAANQDNPGFDVAEYQQRSIFDRVRWPSPDCAKAVSAMTEPG